MTPITTCLRFKWTFLGPQKYWHTGTTATPCRSMTISTSQNYARYGLLFWSIKYTSSGLSTSTGREDYLKSDLARKIMPLDHSFLPSRVAILAPRRSFSWTLVLRMTDQSRQTGHLKITAQCVIITQNRLVTRIKLLQTSTNYAQLYTGRLMAGSSKVAVGM